MQLTPEEALTIEATNTEEAIITVNAEVHAKDTDVVEHPAKRARLKAKSSIKKQAERMVVRSTRSLCGLALGDNVAVPVSPFDRSKGGIHLILLVLFFRLIILALS